MKSTHFRMREPDRAGAGCGAGNSRRAAFGLLLLLALALLFTPLSAKASEYEPGPYFRLRAGVDFSAGEGMDGLDRSCIVLSSDRWRWEGDYCYYTEPVQIGEEIEFMKEVVVPPEWKNDQSGNGFQVRVTAEAAEILVREKEETGSPAKWFERTREEDLAEADRAGYLIRPGQVRAVIREYEKTADGEREYQNGKTVLPGQHVSKMVRIVLEGTPSELFKKPDPPTGYSPSTPPPAPSRPDTPAPKAPQPVGGRAVTGDEGHLSAFLLLAGASLACLLALILTALRRRNGNRKKRPGKNSGSGEDDRPGKAEKAVLSVLPVLLSGLFMTGALYAYLTDTDRAENTFTAGHNVSTVEETYTPPVLTEGVNEYEKRVKIKNTGNVSCYVRAYLAFSDSETADRSQLSADGKNFSAVGAYLRGLSGGWVWDASDGYCYYTQPLAPGESTSELLRAVRTRCDTPEQVRRTQLIVYEETIQCADETGVIREGADAYKAAWQRFLAGPGT